MLQVVMHKSASNGPHENQRALNAPVSYTPCRTCRDPFHKKLHFQQMESNEKQLEVQICFEGVVGAEH
jgi:hypothetical protein